MNPWLCGSSAVALGLIGAPGAKKPVLAALREREDRRLRADTAVAAGLLHDAGTVEVLVDVLNDPRASQFVPGSVALALGQVGDHRAARVPLGILQPDTVRGVHGSSRKLPVPPRARMRPLRHPRPGACDPVGSCVSGRACRAGCSCPRMSGNFRDGP